jgi:hypothetical protein
MVACTAGVSATACWSKDAGAHSSA